MPLPSKYKSEKEKPILSLTKGTLYNLSQIGVISHRNGVVNGVVDCS